MKKTEALKAIDAAFWRVARCCESTRHWDQYLELIRKDEKGHRNMAPDGIANGLTMGQAVRLFAVKNIFERFVPADGSGRIYTPEAKDFFSIRHDIFAAVALVDICRAGLRNEFTDHEMLEWLNAIDYAELNRDPRQQERRAA